MAIEDSSQWLRSVAASIATAAAFMLAGCAAPTSYVAPVTKFQQASGVVIDAAREEYKLANKRQRDAVIDEASYKRIPVGTPALLGGTKSSPQSGANVISPEALKLRLAALDLLEKHGTLLLELANNSAGASVRKSADSIGKSVTEIKGLTGAGKGPADSPEGSKVQSSLIRYADTAGLIAQYVIEARVERAISTAIMDGASTVHDLINALRIDAQALFDGRKVLARQARVRALDNFNAQIKAKASAESIAKAGAQLKAAADAEESLSVVPPLEQVIKEMGKAHAGLVDFARSAKSPQSFSDLVDAMDTFADRATELATSIAATQMVVKE
ncbi:hypothetical protein [Variovorax paradoxus]|jgi:hypothetical protein|uniref:hypothetical protein n=1 Tax=Variovorax paradoxus TaxID=34073 RepID=UPI00339A89E1